MVEPTKEDRAVGIPLAALAKGEIELSHLAGLDSRDLAEILHFALAQMQVGRNEAARRVLEALVALDSKNPIFVEYLGLALERTGDLEAAHRAYTDNIDRLQGIGSPGDRLAEGYLLRARLLAKLGRFDEASGDLERSRSHDPGAEPALEKERQQLLRALEGRAR